MKVREHGYVQGIKIKTDGLTVIEKRNISLWKKKHIHGYIKSHTLLWILNSYNKKLCKKKKFIKATDELKIQIEREIKKLN